MTKMRGDDDSEYVPPSRWVVETPFDHPGALRLTEKAALSTTGDASLSALDRAFLAGGATCAEDHEYVDDEPTTSLTGPRRPT